MQHYIIDGNNLIGKIKSLRNLQKKDGKTAREKLALLIDRFFAGKQVKITLDFDGYENLSIRLSKGRIYYSQSKTADDLIKHQIEMEKNPRNVIVISSDSNVIEFARVCHCNLIKSEEFSINLQKQKDFDEEENLKRNISNNEIKKLFGLE